MERLKDKVAIVTGAADGMGEAVVKLFAAEGAQVLGVDLNAEKLKEAHGAATNSIKLMDIDVTADDADEKIVITVATVETNLANYTDTFYPKEKGG